MLEASHAASPHLGLAGPGKAGHGEAWPGGAWQAKARNDGRFRRR